jgi:3-oxoacyl-[acyl-carrier protein] reductase
MTDPVALITGGSRGIGRATARQLALDGYDIAFCYAEQQAAARELEKELTGMGRNVYARRADVSDPKQVSTLIAGTVDALGPITALVASAAITRDRPLALMEDADWDAVLRVNLDGVYHVCRAVIEEMMVRRKGTIVTLSSLAGQRGRAGQANYAAAKAGIIGFTKSLAQEMGRYQVRANTVIPGFISTGQLAELPEEVLRQATERIALRRLGRPEEVADLISFLLSDRATYLTGAVFTADGGLD